MGKQNNKNQVLSEQEASMIFFCGKAFHLRFLSGLAGINSEFVLAK